MSTLPRPRVLRVAAALIVVSLSGGIAGCFVQSVDLAGKECDLQHSCDVGYACTDVRDGGIGTCTPDSTP